MLGMTIVSLLPHNLEEYKPGLRPENFTIPKAPKGGFSLTYISDVKEGRKIPFQKHLLIMDKNPKEVAESIVNDYVRGVLAKGDNAQPGIFCVEGVLTEDEVKKIHSGLLDKYTQLQKNWYINLVKQADNDFARTKQPKMVSDLQRNAAKELGLKREWQFDESHTFTECPACMSPIKPAAIVCATCGYVINKIKHAEMFPDSTQVTVPSVPQVIMPKTKKSDESLLETK